MGFDRTSCGLIVFVGSDDRVFSKVFKPENYIKGEPRAFAASRVCRWRQIGMTISVPY